jgi:organic radical activating enzyme
LNRILFFQTTCNLSCSYCHFKFYKGFFTGYGRTHSFFKYLTSQEVIDGLKKFEPYHLEFTGGEPLTYPYFKSLVSNLPNGCTWAITSNTLLDVKNIDFSKNIAWTASAHAIDSTSFQDNIKFLKDKVNLSVSFVVEFAKTKEILTKANKARQDLGIRVNLLRELNPKINWKDTEEQKLLRSMPAPFFNVVEDDIPESYEFTKGWECSGGRDYLCLFSDGQIYNCYSDAMTRQKSIALKDYVKSDGTFSCFNNCLGCAEDHKSRTQKLTSVE